MKLVKEILYERFTDDSDAIHDMGIGVKKVYYRFYSRGSNYVLLFTGDTFGLRDILKRHEFEWNPGDYGWKSRFSFPQDWWLNEAPLIFKEIESKPGYKVELKGKIKYITGLNASFSIPEWDNAQYPEIPDGQGTKVYFKQWHHHAPMIGVMGKGSYGARKVLAYEGYLFNKEQHRWEAVYDPDDTDELIEYLKSKNYTVIDGRNNKPMLVGQMHEKFTEHSDPIKDMGIGSAKFFKAEFKRLNHEVLGDVYNELEIKKYNVDNPDFETTICVIFIDMLKKLGEKESVPNAFHDTYKKWRDWNNNNENRTPAPSYAKHIIRQILKEKYGLEWEAQKVYEKFSTESDPIHDMGIGVSYLTLTPGAILAPTQWMSIGKHSGKIVGAGKGASLRPGMFLLVLRVMRTMDKIQSIQVMVYNNTNLEYVQKEKEDFDNIKSEVHRYANKVTLRIPENQFNKRFEIIEKGF